jgi:hypothetical protein
MAEDGRPSGRGHLKPGCLVGLVLLPLVLMRALLAVAGEVGGLYPTPSRLALLEDVAEGRVHRDPYDTAERYYTELGNRTARVKELLGAGLVEQGEDPDAPTVLSKPVRLTDVGRSIIEKGQTR